MKINLPNLLKHWKIIVFIIILMQLICNLMFYFLDIEEIIMSDEDNLDISPLISLYYINIESPNNAISILVNSFNEDNKTFFHSLSLINEREFNCI